MHTFRDTHEEHILHATCTRLALGTQLCRTRALHGSLVCGAVQVLRAGGGGGTDATQMMGGLGAGLSLEQLQSMIGEEQMKLIMSGQGSM